MQHFQVKVLQHRGSSYEIGKTLGQQARHNPIVQTFEKITRDQIDVQAMESIYTAFAPHVLEELRGLAEGLELTWGQVCARFGGYDVPKTEAMGCSAILTRDYYVRNYDFSPDFYDGFFSLLQPDQAFATAGYNLQLIGRHDGVNEHGLVIGLHFVSNAGYTRGISAWTAVRMVLDTCRNVEDAIQLLQELPHAACYNFSIGDKSGDLAVVEASPEGIQVRRDAALLSCVNHFQTDLLAPKNRSIIAGSVKRNAYMQGLQDKAYTQDEMVQLFKDKESPLFFRDYADLFGTLHTFSYAYQDARIVTVLAQGERFFTLNFADWVRGHDTAVEWLAGKIEEENK
ncbi:C45 family autoproteolytic acyltransferase/hydolase [Brevibacillus panacihumi]|uniref:C45 family autoproteolytic acyltransferase/hydolase n=1 Tax=Brevibacillus panacihumi TaxID=497735 RepID=UPI003D1F82BE